MREKLIEFIRNADKEDYESRTQDEHYAAMADHLIANGVTIQKWIPVSERLPELNADVLVCDTRENYISVWQYISNGLWYGNEVIWATEDVTHWMPLPSTEGLK